MVALFVSVFEGTFVCTVKDEEPTSPEPFSLSLAVQGTTTSTACHTAVGGVQLTVGRVRSVFIVRVGVAVLTLLPSFVTCVSTTFELSVAAKVRVVVPSEPPGIRIDPVEPPTLPDEGLGAFTPVACQLIALIVGNVDGGFELLLGTVSMLLKLTLTGPFIQPPFSGGFVVILVLG
jgi:hypothetical protein